jgi:nucleotide sugar dehydrogenase
MNKNKNVCIIGLGFVGKHLVDLFSKKNDDFNVYGVDISYERRKYLTNIYGTSVQIRPSLQFLKDSLIKMDIYIICLPTLLNNNSTPNTSVFYDVKNKLQHFLTKDSLVIIESSVSVGFTRSLFHDLHQNIGFSLAFSPERVDPGNNTTLDKIPKVVSGIDIESLEYIKSIYTQVFDNIVPVSSLECAEMSKLYENCFRLINIAYANEISNLCDQKGIDALEMINACSTKPYGFMPFTPSLGVGGHCIPINPYYLMYSDTTPILKMCTTAVESRVLEKANKIKDKNLKNVLIIGAAYKPGQTSTENSSGIKLYNELKRLNVNSKIYDPLVSQINPELRNFLEKENFNLNYLINNFDCIIISIKQHNVDFSILENYPGYLIKY